MISWIELAPASSRVHFFPTQAHFSFVIQPLVSVSCLIWPKGSEQSLICITNLYVFHLVLGIPNQTKLTFIQTSYRFPTTQNIGIQTILSIRSDQIRSVAQSCPTLCDPMNRSTPGLPVHHQLPEVTQTHVHRVSDAIQPSHPPSSPSPPAPNPSQHQSLFQWVNSSHEVAKVLEFQI